MKTNDHALAAGHSVDPARWQEAFDALMDRIAGRFTRVEFFGEPECTAGCCGALSAVVQRAGGIVSWSDWKAPRDEYPPHDLHFEATQYDDELARAEADHSWRTS
ncbi:hypothetical protein [Streptomyces californicus]|uniref:hypothetical protein n=1 Tax=Streptomyces californicus TaxID=67351 RepID=UPI0037AC7F18